MSIMASKRLFELITISSHQDDMCTSLQKQSETIGQNVHHTEQTVSQLESKLITKKKEMKGMPTIVESFNT